jgi:hypothetical protein
LEKIVKEEELVLSVRTFHGGLEATVYSPDFQQR